MAQEDPGPAAAAASIGRGYLAPELLAREVGAHGRVERLPAPAGAFDAATCTQLLLYVAGVTPERAEQWRAGLWRLQTEGAFFFCVNRFLFTAVKR